MAMMTFSELKAEQASMDEEIDCASRQDYELPRSFWVRYEVIRGEIRRLTLADR